MEKEEKKKIMLKNIEIAVLSIIIVALLTLIIYMVFIKKDDKEGVDNNYVFTKLEREVLDNHKYKYITNNFTFITVGGQCGEEFKEVIDNKGNKIEFIDDYYQLTDFKIENRKLIATDNPDCPCLDYDNQHCAHTKVELVYDGTSITVNKINNEENEGVGKDGNYTFTELEKVELNENNKSIILNGKIIKLKSVVEDNSIVYVNDKKTFSADGPGTIYAYITNNLIAVYWEGSMWGNIVGYIGRDGRIITSPVSTYPVSLSSLYIENNKLMATRDYNGEIDCGIPENASKCKTATKVELVYNGNTIEIKEVK